MLAAQVPLLIDHTKVFTPAVSPVTPDVGEAGIVTTPVPAITVQAPLPVVGVLAASVAVGLQIV